MDTLKKEEDDMKTTSTNNNNMVMDAVLSNLINEGLIFYENLIHVN